ncbi:TonB-dependent SusC/RagA subfamily outer membrane receptor [Chryseobacterium sp. 52]|uniref:TonB-dependent receptor plug domain-containing protein n=1 Tax=Chryseobacterium sp. 52 TaxID=2035213 RepID=UPI000C19F563|nr:TonB-dependent receptor plug domain-containing protein [Chryseobacterium sp. 52]PIF46564.1 TonB-dependent SusC/RagA subfamily outer membrane receptor [Chryseobacterium sp. 52]
MDFKTTNYIILLILLFSNVDLKAQNQFKDFEKEKTYIQTSHVFYKPGEEMYFKIYVVKAENNLPADQSKVVNFELIDPSGSVIKKAKYEIQNGYVEGYFSFSDDMKGGVYKIRAFTNWMQNEEGKNVFEKEITLQKIVSPRILMKLDFPKKGYGAGDEVIADFSMRSLSNQPIPFYEGDYMVMHNGETISEGKFITDKEGKKQLKFNLPKVLKSSDALLNIKINFDGFTESISRNIPIVLNYLDLKLMPEGGTFINGIEQNMAFKVLDELEKSVDAVLEIFNQDNKKILESTAYNFGMGSFLFTPKKGETYYAKVVKPENINQKYQLPIAKDEGVILNLYKENRKVYGKIISTDQRNIVLKGSFREKEIYNHSISLQKGLNQFEISEKELPSGICRFTVFEGGIPLAERIVFANENRQMNVKIKPVKQQYLPREKVILDIETTDENGQPVPANLAMSVVDDKLWTYADDKQNHILSWILMDSELRGKIERPQFYFDKKEEKAVKSLDLLMLTNGYRYFELIPDVIKNQKYKYFPEKKNPIYGIVEDENGKPVKAEVYLIKGRNVLKQTTSEEGTFYFSDLKTDDTYQLVAKSFQPKQEVKIRILSYRLPVNPLAKKSLNNVNVEEVVKEAVKESEKIKLREEAEKKIVTTEKTKSASENRSKKLYKDRGYGSRKDTISGSRIEEVVILGYNAIKKKDLTASTAVSKNEELQNPDLSSVLSGKVAGVAINPASGQPGSSVLIRGTASVSNITPLYVVDGVPVENFKTVINPNDINSITVLKDAAATSIYGSRGANGVIIINSLKNLRSQLKMDVTPKSYYAVMTIPRDSLISYSYSRDFYYPVYQSTNTSYRFDYRETIYWNPVVETDKKGKAQVEFYNSDANTAFRIMTEGISGTGLIGRNETTYAAQSLISIDAKIPQYLTRTDQMTIPVVIKNNSAETRKMIMDVIVPNRVKLMKFDSIITLKPLESGRLFVTMQTDDIINSNIQFSIRSGDFRETMILPFNVEEKGFPHHYSVINNTSENIKTLIPEYINGSFSSSYYVYENVALQMFEDMERLKREPHGCFEQLSSTVYPNAFILDYLKSIKKITPETESFVIRNMKKGYQKMLNYKNRDGGFGYFNTSESDAAVSAFALLEFRDLKKYVNIDPKIIQNLTSFILSKKNQNGIFEVRKNYEMKSPFSEHAWSRNMYVIYALSKIGLKDQLEEPYQVALNKALVTKDSYQMALMANASAYLGKNKEYQDLMMLLNKQYKDKNEQTEITFTGSKGISASAETLSLYVMALQKDEKQNQLKIAEAADQLINYNGYYGFGSTQATTLALEALSDFFAKNEKLYGAEKPKIKINQVEVAPKISIASAYRAGQNEISIGYAENIQKGLPYKLEYHYYTLQAPESKDIPVTLETKLKSATAKVGETNRMTVTVKNKINGPLPMVVAKIGIPAGLTLQNALLKDLIDKKQVSYYEIFDNYLVLYWEHFDTEETKVINLDLKVEFAGEYTAKASNVYLYYMPELKYWNEGITAKIEY